MQDGGLSPSRSHANTCSHRWRTDGAAARATGTRRSHRPAWQPPGAVFGPVWTVIYVLIAVSATLAWRDVHGPRRRLVLGLFAVNLVLNVAWTWIFFQAHAPEVAGIEIVVLLGTILALVRLLWPANRAAALALVPYAAWVTFATALTWAIAAAN